MTTVGLYTNMHLKCGAGAYGRDLAAAFSQHFETIATDNWEILINTFPNVVVVNWQPSRVALSEHIFKRLKNNGSKIIVILQDTYDGFTLIGSESPLNMADVLVAHEQVTSAIKTEVIPVGIWSVSELREPTEPKIGIAGFPFPWKNFDVTAEAARIHGVKCLLIAPTYEGVETDSYVKGIAGHLNGLAEVHREWLDNEEVVRMLSTCTLNIFWYQSRDRADELGQSGSVRMGIAAGRPMIISRHRKFKTLEPYSDEFYVADTVEQVYEMTGEILASNGNARKPKRILEEMGWPQTTLLWKRLIEDVVC